MIEVAISNLNFDTAYEMAKEMPNLDEIKIGAILAAIEAKGYGAEVIAGFARGVSERSAVDLGEVIDTCGTGGDGANTINVSTAVAIALSTVHPVAKHGNRSISSKSGSADVLEALGVNIEMHPEFAKKMINEIGFAFLFAPLYHRSFAKVGKVRKKLGIRTIFNIIGPLSNPANPAYQIIGVSDRDLMMEVARAADMMGKKAIVVHGSGLDEVSPSKDSLIAIVDNGVEITVVSPEDFGIQRVNVVECKSSMESAERIRSVFAGRGLKEDRNFIAVNFAAAMLALGYEDLRENVEIFESKIENGEILTKLEEIVCGSTSTCHQ